MSAQLPNPRPEIVANVPAAEYHERRLGVASKSALDQVDRSPAHYQHWLAVGTDETPAMAFGRAFHSAVLEPDVFEATYAEQPRFGDLRTKHARACRDSWTEQHGSKVPVSAQDMATIVGMREAVLRHRLASRLLEGGTAELTARWWDSETGLECKCRVDYHRPDRGALVDLKSATDASPDAFQRSVATYRYHVQDAFYRSGFEAAGSPVGHFVFVFVEKSPPHCVAVYSLDADAVGRGHSAARRNIDTLAECVSRDRYPGYPAVIHTLELPPWA